MHRGSFFVHRGSLPERKKQAAAIAAARKAHSMEII